VTATASKRPPGAATTEKTTAVPGVIKRLPSLTAVEWNK
jgi:hypothetical protein